MMPFVISTIIACAIAIALANIFDHANMSWAQTISYWVCCFSIGMNAGFLADIWGAAK